MADEKDDKMETQLLYEEPEDTKDAMDLDKPEGEAEPDEDGVKFGHSPPETLLTEKKPFLFQGKMVWLTYNQSCVTDHLKFYEYLRTWMEQWMPRMSSDNNRRSKVEIFGARELHADGHPHYHVVMRFETKVHWKNSYSRFAAQFEEGGELRQVATSIRIEKPDPGEHPKRFLEGVQGYILKEYGADNDYVFGTYIQPPQGATETRRQQEEGWCREALDLVYQDETDAFLREHFPVKYVWQPHAVAKFVSTKKVRAKPAVKRTYKRKPFKIPKELVSWLRRNIGSRRKMGRPSCLLIVGPSKYGKTEWAKSFGRPIVMQSKFVYDLMTSECTHIVLNDIDLRKFENWRDFMGCQMEVAIDGKYREEKMMDWGKPAIFTANADNNPLKDEAVAQYFKESGGTLVVIEERMF
ncbi:hypothetical protein TruAng_001966 [Truncatella angustata]|nr:hypothetical protein TruAng_001966 [Truncatella angustata]